MGNLFSGGCLPPFWGNSVTVFSRRQKRPTSKAQLHSHLGIAIRQKKAKSKQIPLQAACRGETGLGKGRERKGDSDTGVTNPLRAISATSMLQNACLLCFSCPLNHTDPHRGRAGPLLSKIRYCPGEIWQLCTQPQQSRIIAWGKKRQKPHPHSHPKLSRDLGGRIQPVVGAHLSCPAPDSRGWGHTGAAAAPLHAPLQGHPFSFPYIYHFPLGFQLPSSSVHLCSLFPRFFLHSSAKAPCHSCTRLGCSSSGD